MKKDHQIAKETYVQILQRQKRRLKQLPNDFRDTFQCGKDWEDFAELTGRREEMEAWLHGPVLHLVLLNEHEQRFFGNSKTEQFEPLATMVYGPNDAALLYVLSYAIEGNYSFIYLPMFSRKFVNSLNFVLSELKANLRVWGQIRGTDGHPTGVTH